MNSLGFAPAQAAIFIAAKTARVPHGREATGIHGRLACAFVRLRRPKPPLRDHLMTPDSLLRFARKTPRSHSVPHDHAAGGHRSIAGVKPLNFEARTISDAGFLECFALENICRPDSMFRRRGFSLALLD